MSRITKSFRSDPGAGKGASRGSAVLLPLDASLPVAQAPIFTAQQLQLKNFFLPVLLTKAPALNPIGSDRMTCLPLNQSPVSGCRTHRLARPGSHAHSRAGVGVE